MFIEKIYIINFDDSFTYNIASILYPYCKSVIVVDHLDFFKSYVDKILNTSDQLRISIILGPGPGNPDQFKQYFKLISKLIDKANIYLMGICLGHQIIARIKGYQVTQANNLIHGEQEKIEFKNRTINVQRYNSLSPKSMGNSFELLVVNNEVYIFQEQHLLSFQFHPESIGTENNLFFFDELLEFVSVGKLLPK